MRTRSKSKCNELHARRRAAERFGLNISQRQYEEMNRICSRGDYVCFLERQSNTRSKAVIMYREEYIPVIYDRNRKQVITVLSLNMLTEKETETLNNAIEYKQLKQQ